MRLVPARRLRVLHVASEATWTAPGRPLPPGLQAACLLSAPQNSPLPEPFDLSAIERANSIRPADAAEVSDVRPLNGRRACESWYGKMHVRVMARCSYNGKHALQESEDPDIAALPAHGLPSVLNGSQVQTFPTIASLRDHACMP